MASLRDSVKDYQEELRDGIAWVAFWKQGRSWNAELFHLEVDGTLEPFDRSRLEEIKAADPAAVILNGYYCGHLGENMSLDELTAGVRYHYENGRNDLDGFIGAHDDRLPPEVIEEARAAAHAAGLPFSEKPYRDGEDFDPYIFDGSMSIEDYELMHRMIEKERSEQMDEWKTGYSSYDHDRLEAADKMKIERGIYFDTKGADISPLTALPLAELVKLREESAAAEQTVFENLKVQASAWEEQAGKTLLFDKAIEYARIPEVKHTANKWQDEDNDRHTISNRVYKMSYHVYENTRYDRKAEKSIPYSYTLSWNIYTNSPHGYGQAKIAGQDRKVFADRAAMEKYLNGRIKAYEKLFTEISPAIPPEYAEQFRVNGQLLPGYTVEGEEIKQPAADISAAAPRTEPGQETEQFAILIDSRTRFETGEPGGYWLSMPATKEELHKAMRSVGITADNPQDFFIHGYSDREDRHIALPYDMVCAAQVDELNFLAARLETLDASGIAALNAATQRRNGFENIGQLIDFTYNEDFFVHIPEVHTPRELGDYYLNKSGMVQMPAEWKNSIDPIAFGRNAAAQEKGSFTEYGYLVESGDEWEKHFEGRDVPEEYRIMSYPQPTIELDAAPAVQTATIPEAQQQEPRPVIPIVLTSEKPAEKLKEITDRLEQGITELFDSERYKEYLRVMSKFHNYSFNNTLLIAMQKPDASLIAGFSAWKNNFGRNVMKGQKGIKILAPSPFKIKKEMEKIDPQTQKAIIGKDGKPVTEEKEITIPAFKVVSVFDVSQTEGREIPDIAVNMLTGDVEHYKEVFAALEKTSPVPVGFEKIEGGAHGYYHLEDKRIALDEGMSELQTLKTLIHEIAHAKLHDIDLNAPLEDLENRPDRRTREVQAESIAYTVCQHYGLDTSDYSFGYVAGWSAGRELAELKSSLETIRSTAAEIINSIDEHIAELQKTQEQAQDAPREKAAMPEYIYKIEANPRTTGDNGRFFLQAYLPQENGRAKIGDVLYIGSLAKCRELMGGLNAGELTQGEVKELYAKAQEAEADKDTFSIYQLKQGDETRDFRFEPYDRLQAAGNAVDKANYEIVYSAELTPGTSLEDIYTRFNIDHPKDFKGHSLSVSDVVVLHQNGENTAHYVDSGSFRNVPEFLQEKQSQLIPDEHLTGKQIRTPRGSFYVSDMSVEQMKEAGYGLHHQSDDGKYLIMGNSTRAFAVAAEQPEKANPLKHIEDTIEQNDNNFDGIINNTPQTPTVDALEQKAKAGEVISLVDLADAIKADKEQGKTAKPEKKPSIRAQLKADKEKAQKKPQKSKSQDLERS
ncbi:antirestriction protein ArdA [Roseburia sp. BX1005]|uniref:Antirestriction protein ArdA n=1 Tax=Roseburia zhanii TaxID=2763064 RepID=A0A923RUZ8_9FIRM|nr:YodL domain-containing protein [Roseburia zhanii]MBC5713739.1 antirestriction protein ArdA [Roseburia zhanii]